MHNGHTTVTKAKPRTTRLLIPFNYKIKGDKVPPISVSDNATELITTILHPEGDSTDLTRRSQQYCEINDVLNHQIKKALMPHRAPFYVVLSIRRARPLNFYEQQGFH